MGHFVAKFGPFYVESVNLRKNAYVVHNSLKEFDHYHTHINNENLAISIAKCANRKQLPKSKSVRNIISLIRITDDEKYKNELKDLLIIVEERNRTKYANKSKGSRRK